MRLGRDLIVEFVFSKPEHGDEVGAVPDGELDEAFAALEHELEQVRLRVEGFASAPDHDGDCAAHAFVVWAALGEEVVARFPAYGCESQCEGVVTVDGDAEVGVESQESVGNAGEELGEAEGFGAEGGEGAVRNDAVRVVAEYVFAG